MTKTTRITRGRNLQWNIFIIVSHISLFIVIVTNSLFRSYNLTRKAANSCCSIKNELLEFS